MFVTKPFENWKFYHKFEKWCYWDPLNGCQGSCSIIVMKLIDVIVGNFYYYYRQITSLDKIVNWDQNILETTQNSNGLKHVNHAYRKDKDNFQKTDVTHQKLFPMLVIGDFLLHLQFFRFSWFTAFVTVFSVPFTSQRNNFVVSIANQLFRFNFWSKRTMFTRLILIDIRIAGKYETPINKERLKYEF